MMLITATSEKTTSPPRYALAPISSKAETYHIDPLSLSGFTGIPLLAGLTLTALMARRWRGVIPVALVVGPLAAIGTIFSMTVPADLDTVSTTALAATHVAVGVFAIVGTLTLRSVTATRVGWG